jgi:four helix bundle protein
MSSGLRELKLWQEAVALAGDVTRATRAAGRREARGVAERLGLVGCAVAEAVADAHGRYDARDQQRAYRSARRNLLVLETSIAIARHAELLSAPVAAQLAGRAGNVSRLLAGYLAFLERQIAAEDAARGAPEPEAPISPADRLASAATAGPPAGGPAVFVEP